MQSDQHKASLPFCWLQLWGDKRSTFIPGAAESHLIPCFGGLGGHKSSLCFRYICTAIFPVLLSEHSQIGGYTKAAWMNLTQRSAAWGESAKGGDLRAEEMGEGNSPLRLTCSACELQPQFRWWNTLPHWDRRPGPCLPHTAWRPLNANWEVWGPPL